MRCAIASALLLAIMVKPAVADERADKLIREVVAKYTSLRTMTGTITLTSFKAGKPVVVSGPLRLMKPNRALVEVNGAWASAAASDGKQLIRLMTGNRYMTEPAGDNGSAIKFGSGFQIPMFFVPAEVFDGFKAFKPTYKGKQKLGAETFDVLVVTQPIGTKMQYTMYVTPDKLVKRVEIEVLDLHSKTISEISNVKLNVHLTNADLAYKLPKGAVLFGP